MPFTSHQIVMKLVGTIHVDLEGPRRLEHLLQLHKPGVVTVECPRNLSIDETVNLFLARRAVSAEVLESTEMPAFLRDYYKEYFSILGYEIVVAAEYAREEGAQIYPVDHPDIAKLMSFEVGKEALIKELKEVADAALLQLAQSQIDASKITYAQARPGIVKQIDMTYFDPDLFKKLVGSMDITRKQTENMLIRLSEQQRRIFSDPAFGEEREQSMANAVLERNPDMNIGGVAHILEGPTEALNVVPLYARLGNKVTERIRLCDAFKTSATQ